MMSTLMPIHIDADKLTELKSVLVHYWMPHNFYFYSLLRFAKYTLIILHNIIYKFCNINTYHFLIVSLCILDIAIIHNGTE